MNNLNILELKSLLIEFKKTLSVQRNIINALIREVELLEKNEGKTSLSNKIVSKSMDGLNRILIELLKHKSAEEVLHWIEELLKKFPH